MNEGVKMIQQMRKLLRMKIREESFYVEFQLSFFSRDITERIKETWYKNSCGSEGSTDLATFSVSRGSTVLMCTCKERDVM